MPAPGPLGPGGRTAARASYLWTNEAVGVVETAALLREITAGLIGSAGLDDALRRLAETLGQALPGVRRSSVTLLRAGEPASVAASDPATLDLDDLRSGAEGPALTAIRTRDLVLAGDLRSDDRWPDWTRRALAAGIGGVVAAPVDVDDQVIGAISLYAEQPATLAAHQLTAMLAAEHAGLLLAAVRDRDRWAGQLADLGDSVGAGEIVGQAVGVVMTQRRCSATAALQVLRDASESLSIPLREVAQRLVTSVAGPDRS